MIERKDLLVANLLFDEENPRLPQAHLGQSGTLRSMARRQGIKLQSLAADILREGLNLAYLFIVTPHPTQTGYYIVLDGNRRLAAIRAMEAPDQIAEVMAVAVASAIKRLSSAYRTDPIEEVHCLVVEQREEADHWIELAHTGEMEGAGSVLWGTDESARFKSRITGKPPNLGTQALNFLEGRGVITPDQRTEIPSTTLTRLLTTPPVRTSMGLILKDGALRAIGEPESITNALAYVVKRLRERRLTVNDVRSREQRDAFAKAFPSELRVDSTIDPVEAMALHDIQPSNQQGRGIGIGGDTLRRNRQKPPPPRNCLIPPDCVLDINSPRLRAIEQELRRLRLDVTPNAVGVLLRVFLELSMDAYIRKEQLPIQERARLSQKLSGVKKHLLEENRITEHEAIPVEHAAAKDSFLSPSVTVLHAWIHNPHMNPVGRELRTHWDNLQPFMVAVWPQLHSQEKLPNL